MLEEVEEGIASHMVAKADQGQEGTSREEAGEEHMEHNEKEQVEPKELEPLNSQQEEDLAVARQWHTAEKDRYQAVGLTEDRLELVLEGPEQVGLEVVVVYQQP